MRSKSSPIVALVSTALLAMLTVPAVRSEDQWPTVPQKSPLHELVEEYLPNDYKPGEDPLTTPEMHKNSAHLVELGWKFFNSKDFDTSLRRFLLAIRTEKTNAKAYFGVAYVCCIQNNIDDAITFYREALKYEKNFAPIYANLARALLMKDSHSSEAPKLLDEAIKVDPKFAESYITYAKYYTDKDDWKSAAEKMNQAIDVGRKLEPDAVSEFKKHGINLHGN